jgi:predicted ArsR family transcriptional regulator
MNEPAPIELHKALADDTPYRLYRYLRLSGRPVAVRELATRLGLHANTIRPHLRRLVDAGLGGGGSRPGPAAGGRPPPGGDPGR